MSAAAVIVGYALRESMRRRVFAVVLVLTLGFLGLYALGTAQAFSDTQQFAGPDPTILDANAFTGATLVGLAMFATLFLGAVLSVFLTLGVVRGDAERGLLQPLVVRPIGRAVLLLARFAAAAAVSAVYVVAVYAGTVVLTGAIGGWWPDSVVIPGLALAGAVAVITALSLLGSVFLSATANGIAVFMVFGAGLTAGLLGQVGEAIDSKTLQDIADVASWIVPFEALYQAGLNALTSGTNGLTGVIVSLGPFGGAERGGPVLVLYAVAYLAAVLGLGIRAFARRDL